MSDAREVFVRVTPTRDGRPIVRAEGRAIWRPAPGDPVTGSTERVRCTLRPRNGYFGGYDVAIARGDGRGDHPIGHVEQHMVNHDRKPAGSRIVTSRTTSPRWFSSSSRIWHDTLIDAVAALVAERGGWENNQ